MTARAATWIGGGAAVLCGAAYIVAAALLLTSPQSWDYAVVMPLAYPVVGAIIVSQQPRNTIGWLLVICGTSIALGVLCAAIVFATLDPQPTIWQQILAWVTNMTFISGLQGLLLTMAFLFPTGRTLSQRWRLAGIAVALAYVVIYFPLGFRPGPLEGLFDDTPELTNPFGIPGIDTFSQYASFLGAPIAILMVLTSLSAMVTRFRRARDVERLQLQWLALALGFALVSALVAGLAGAFAPGSASWVSSIAGSIFFATGTLGVSAAIGIAILRHQLYDIERLVNRGLVYLTLSIALTLVYIGLTLLLGNTLRALSGISSGIVTAVATLSAAALFAPLRNRIQHVVDRRFYRRKYDAARMVDDFSTRLRDEVDLDALSRGLQAVVTESMQPTHVSLWLRPTSPAPSLQHRPARATNVPLRTIDPPPGRRG